MGLNRMMMMAKKGNVADGSKFWGPDEVDDETIAFTVPPGIKRIKVFAIIRRYQASIKNQMTNTFWGEGSRFTSGYKDINSIVGVTPNKTYTLHFKCAMTSGVTFSWGQAINNMAPTVEDY